MLLWSRGGGGEECCSVIDFRVVVLQCYGCDAKGSGKDSSLKITCSLSFRKVKVEDVSSVLRCLVWMLSCMNRKRVTTATRPQSKQGRWNSYSSPTTKLKPMAAVWFEWRQAEHLHGRLQVTAEHLLVLSDSQTAGNTWHTCSFPALLIMLFEVHFLYLTISQNGSKPGFLHLSFRTTWFMYLKLSQKCNSELRCINKTTYYTT